MTCMSAGLAGPVAAFQTGTRKVRLRAVGVRVLNRGAVPLHLLTFWPLGSPWGPPGLPPGQVPQCGDEVAGKLTGDGGGEVTGSGGGVVTGGVVTGDGGGVVTGGVVTGDGGGVVTGDGGGVVTGDGGGEVTGSGGGMVTGDGGPGSAGVVRAGAGVPPASSPVPAAWDWLAVACAGLKPGGSGGTTRSGRPGLPGSPPVAAGTVTAAPGRACTAPVDAVCHSHSATPVVATATAAVGASSHGDSSHPNGSRRGRLTRGGLTRGRPRRGGTDVVANQSPNASDSSAGRPLPKSRSGGVTGAAGQSRTGRRRTPAVRALPGRRRGGSRCDRRVGR